jgi:hypothetical protein
VLTTFQNRVQWIVYRKADKVPVHPEGLFAINPHDPANWMRGDVALSWAKFLGPAYGPGIVLWKGCGLFCIDIDKALVDGQWSPLAQALCSQFSGAYQEVSQSGKAIHIFASYKAEMPPHRKKNVPLHLEMYDDIRFIGVTGTNAVGDESFDATHMIPNLIAQYFPPGPEASAEGWTTDPAPEWDGPADDDELIRRMCASKSAGAIFGSKASVYDLLTANVDALAKAFPPQTAGKDYDGSSADQAFANHLAFWTGGNCDRMLAIMERSALNRPKWQREGYLRGTILNAAAWQRTYYKQRSAMADIPPAPAAPTPNIQPNASPIPPPPPAPTIIVAGVEVPAVPAAMPVAVPETGHGKLLTGTAQKLLFEGCIYVQDVNQIMVPNGHTLKHEPFDNDLRFRGRSYIMDLQGKAVDSAWEAFTQSKIEQFPTVRGTFFDPRKPEGAYIQRIGQDYVNTWRDPHIECAPGDVTLYTSHIQKLFPNGDDALIYTSYVAACVQNLGTKAAWALLVQGTPGNGKSFLTKVMQYCLGLDYVYSAAAANLDNNFNGYLYRKLMILVEEIKTIEGNAATWEKLKTMITEQFQEIESKGVDQVTREVCFNMIFNSNHKDGLRKTADDRRICPLFCAQQSVADLKRDGMDEPYFIRLFDWFDGGGNANILHYLRTFPIPDHYNFAKGARRAPTTSSTLEAISAGLGSIEQDILEAVSVGKSGFKGGWISGDALGILLAQSPRGKFLARSKRLELLLSLGYVKHPQLPDGRLTADLPTGGRPVLYVQAEHSSIAVQNPLLIRELFINAQK